MPRHCLIPVIRQALLAAALALLTACSSQPVAPPDPAAANEVLFSAMNQVGKPYRYGGNSPATGFDCSGLVGYVYRQGAGISLPRTVAAMDGLPGPAIARDALANGDLLIFATGGGRRPDHAGIYVGQGRFVHAPSRGGVVRLDQLGDRYWDNSFLRGRRPLAR